MTQYEGFVVTETQKQIAAEIKALAIGEVPRVLTPGLYVNRVNAARKIGPINVAFWYGPDYKSRYLVIFRIDRRPEPEEYLPWVQLLLESKYVHSGSTEFSVEFIEGDIYEPDESMAEKMGEAISSYAEGHGDVTK